MYFLIQRRSLCSMTWVILTILYGVSHCEAMHDSNNNPCQKLPPAVLPQELVKLKYSQWKKDVFAPNKPRFSQFWNE